MASTICCFNAVNLSTPTFSRIRFPNLEFSPLSHLFTHSTTASGKASKRISGEVRAAQTAAAPVNSSPETKTKKNLRVLIAGGGIGGLVLALALKRKGFEVLVFERDLSAIRGEGQYRGPIQIQSNALAALEAIDMEVADQVMALGCVTGDRINGLVDGISGNWYVKFDTFSPAAEKGLPVTRVISRMSLQQILAGAVGDDVILNESNVVDFRDWGEKVSVVLENGETFEGDVLIGADGIRSKVRRQLLGESEAVYSEYTCYTGIAEYVPADIDTVGYRVFLGHKQYFVSSDVGGGKMQWYAFHKEAAGGVDGPEGKKERVKEIFEGWCENVTELIRATEEEVILRRDIYDKAPTVQWGKGRVSLLGDSVHAMQPNLGQGGCMAIEDAFELALALHRGPHPLDVPAALRRYEDARRLRVAVIHGMARMAALMASTYKPYLGLGLGPFEFLTKYRIPHPGRVGGRFFIDLAMPLMLNWVLGGNSSKLEGRPQSCRLTDKASDQLRNWFEDDDALERAMNAEWYLFPSGKQSSESQPIHLNRDESKACIIGSEPQSDTSDSTTIAIPYPQVSEKHARIEYKDGAFFVTDLQSEHGTWLTETEGRRYRIPPNFPTRFRPSDAIQFGSDEKAAFRVKAISSSSRVLEKKDASEMLQTA